MAIKTLHLAKRLRVDAAAASVAATTPEAADCKLVWGHYDGLFGLFRHMESSRVI